MIPLFVEHECAMFLIYQNSITTHKLASEQPLCERVLNRGLDGPLQRPRTVYRIVTGCGQRAAAMRADIARAAGDRNGRSPREES